MEKVIEKISTFHEGLNVYISAFYESTSVEGDFDFGSDSENKAYLKRFESGELINVSIEVAIYDKSGELEGIDNLGCCHVTSSNLENDILEIVKDHAMIETAHDELKRIYKHLAL